MTKMDAAKTPETKLAGLRKVALQELLNGARELVIVHNGREYRLRLTQNGKLILTA